MKAYWLEGEALRSAWEALPSGEEPFADYSWWRWAGVPFGALGVEKEGDLQGLLPIAFRRVGWVRLYRQPLGIPWLPWVLKEPLPERRDLRYGYQARVLRAVGEWIQAQRWMYMAGAFSAAWDYLPPWYQGGVRLRLTGSFVLRPSEFFPSADLRRKVRQAASLLLREVSMAEALPVWAAHAPKGISSAFSQILHRLANGPFAWRAWCVGEPPEAVGIFLWGKSRVWYIAGTTLRQGQALTRLLYETIERAHREGKEFDFMGSVLPGVERFFRQFGGRWESRPFLSIWRVW